MSETTKQVYPTFSHQGIKFRLLGDGTVMAAARFSAEEAIGKLTFNDTSLPWIPKHKNFNSICRQMVREGDLDHIIKVDKKEKEKLRLKRKAAPELYESLQDLCIYLQDGIGDHESDELMAALAALAKARGEQP